MQWDEVGASFQDGYGIQGVTRETRACGLQGLPAVGEIDLIAAHYQAFWLALVETSDGTLMDTHYRIICLYFENAALWRLQVASYYAISDEDAKKICPRLPLDSPILPDEEWEPVLYLPAEPSVALMMDALPATVSIDAATGTFVSAAWRRELVLPFVAVSATVLTLLTL